jgi:hypothetical protein
MNDGVLRPTLPKVEKAMPRQITVKDGNLFRVRIISSFPNRKIIVGNDPGCPKRQSKLKPLVAARFNAV